MSNYVTTWNDARRKLALLNPATRLENSMPRSTVVEGASGNETHIREHGSVLATAEKTALIWMAQRMPRWINSDHLTLLGFAAMLLAGASYAIASHNRWALLMVVVALALNWLGDSLDGTLARVRNQQRPRYGFYVDHIADTFGALALMTGLGYSGYIHWRIA